MNEGEIRRLMNLQVAYEDCLTRIEAQFEKQKVRDKLPDATLDSELLDLEVYRRRQKPYTAVAQEALDLIQQADDIRADWSA